jgi:hypothetical protein
MSDPVTGDGQSQTSSASSEPARPMSRIRATLLLLRVVALTAILVIVFSTGVGNMHG